MKIYISINKKKFLIFKIKIGVNGDGYLSDIGKFKS